MNKLQLAEEIQINQGIDGQINIHEEEQPWNDTHPVGDG
jgi:hypothetical protein